MANGRLILPALGLRNTKRMVQHRLTILRTGCPLSPQVLNNTHVAPMRTTLSFEMAGIPILVGLVHTPAEGILQVARVRVPSEVDNVRYHPMLSGGEHVSRFATAAHGVVAHIVHLAWYAYPGHLEDPFCRRVYEPDEYGDPRHSEEESGPHRGNVRVVQDLGGKWAPSPQYGEAVLNHALGIAQSKGW